MNTTVFGLLAVWFFAFLPLAEAQQPGKIFRIGFLDPSTPSGMAVMVDAFRQELNKLGWIEGKNITISIGLPSKRANAYPSLQRTWFVSRLI